MGEESIRQVRSGDSTGEDSNGQRKSRTKDRKGTGFVSKQQFLEFLQNASDEEDDDEEKDAPVPQIQPKDVHERCKARKSTGYAGYVSKNKLKKVLMTAGS